MLPRSLTVHRDGVILSGAGIGTDAFVCLHAAKQVDGALTKATRLLPLGQEHPQAAWRLLGPSINGALGYLARVTPTKFLQPVIPVFDGGVEAMRRSFLAPPFGEPPPCSAFRTETATLLASQPMRNGGAGHVPLSVMAPIAFCASVAQATVDPDVILSQHLSVFTPWMADSLDAVFRHLGGSLLDPPVLPPKLAKLLPTTPAGFFDKSLYPDLFQIQPNIRIQATLLEAAHNRSRMVIQERCHPDQVATTDGFTDEDAAHVALLTNSSQASRCLQAPLWFREHRMSPDRFRTYVRYMLNLPQLLRLGNDTWSDKFGCQVDVCHSTHNKNRELCPSGAHACSKCPNVTGARYRAHAMLAKAFHKLAPLAGLCSLWEPSTYDLLHGHVSREQCRVVFPKDATDASNALAERLNQLLYERDIIVKAGIPEELQARLVEINSETAHITSQADSQMQARRIDICLRSDESGQECYIDVAGVHPTVKSYLPQTIAHVRAVYTAQVLSGGRRLPPTHPLARVPSEAIRRRVELKNKTYYQLSVMTALQKAAGKRSTIPVFHAAVVSHIGEFSQGLFNAIEFCVAARRRQLNLQGERPDGLSVAFLTAQYRTLLKDRLACANAIGFADMLMASGLSRPKGLRQAGRW